jgi:hypothetical protein
MLLPNMRREGRRELARCVAFTLCRPRKARHEDGDTGAGRNAADVREPGSGSLEQIVEVRESSCMCRYEGGLCLGECYAAYATAPRPTIAVRCCALRDAAWRDDSQCAGITNDSSGRPQRWYPHLLRIAFLHALRAVVAARDGAGCEAVGSTVHVQTRRARSTTSSTRHSHSGCTACSASWSAEGRASSASAWPWAHRQVARCARSSGRGWR